MSGRTYVVTWLGSWSLEHRTKEFRWKDDAERWAREVGGVAQRKSVSR